MNEPTFFKPHVLTRDRQPNVAPIVRESRLIRDLTMPPRDWSEFDAPARERRTSRVIRNQQTQVV